MRYAVAVIGQNIVIDCGSHDEAMRVVERVSVSADNLRSSVKAFLAAREAVEEAHRKVAEAWDPYDEASGEAVVRGPLGQAYRDAVRVRDEAENALGAAFLEERTA